MFPKKYIRSKITNIINIFKVNNYQQLTNNYLLVAEGDTSFRQVIRTHFDLYAVTGENLDVMHTHLTGDMRDDEGSVFELHAEHSVGQSLNYRSVHFDAVLFCHKSNSLLICC